MTTAWWQGFFDRTYTHLYEAGGRFETTAEEVEGLQALLPAPTGLRILDAPCGFGRHSGPLHDAGHDVTGLDASPDQLALARERHPGPTYVLGDVAEPPDGPFDVVLNLFTSLGYAADDEVDRSVLQAFHDVLVPGGVLVVTANHRDRVARVHQPDVPLEMGDSGATETPSVDWVRGVVTSVLELPDGTRRWSVVRLYSATELVALARSAGFVDVEVHGDLDRTPLSPDTRLVLVARRATA